MDEIICAQRRRLWRSCQRKESLRELKLPLKALSFRKYFYALRMPRCVVTIFLVKALSSPAAR
jgi:hypothetical protein